MRRGRSPGEWYRIAAIATALAACLSLGLGAEARAQAARRPRAVAPDPAADEARRAHERAIALFEQSVEAYRAARFADAAALLREAYGLEPASILLFNLARALDADGQLAEARDAYRRYLEAEPAAEQRATCERRIEVLTSQIDAASRPAPPEGEEAPSVGRPGATPVPAPTPVADGGDVVGPWIVTGTGLALAVAGGVLVGVAFARHDAAVAEPVSLRAAEIDAEAVALRDAGIATLVVGGVAAAVGIVWTIAASPRGAPTDATTVSLGPLGMRLQGSF